MKRLLCLLVFLAAGAAFAQKPPAELKQLQPFEGKWSCKGMVFAGDWGPEHPVRFTMEGRWNLGGYWLRTDDIEEKTPKSPYPLRGIGQWGYDADMKKFVEMWTDNFGTYEVAHSDGWNGDTMVFQGPAHGGGQNGTARDTFTKKGKNQIDHVYDLEVGGTWKKVESDSCKK